MANYTSSHTGSQVDTTVDQYQTASQVQTAINNAIAAAKLAMYPIGSIYISTSSTNPSTYIGGTWEQIEDTFLLAAGTTYSAGSTGGAASAQHTHNYGIQYGGYYEDITFESDSRTGLINFDTAGNQSLSVKSSVGASTVSANGGNTASTVSRDSCAHYKHIANTSYSTINTLPPYLAVYVFQRTA